MSAKITIITPQFERPAGEPPPPSLPASWEEFNTLDMMALREMGLQQWNDPATDKDFGWSHPGKVLFLFPAEWYPFIPDGMEIVDINGRTEKFKRGKTDDDMRFGCLAYGRLVVTP